VIGTKPVDRDQQQQRGLHRLLRGRAADHRDHGQRQDQPEREPDRATAVGYHGGDSI